MFKIPRFSNCGGRFQLLNSTAAVSPLSRFHIDRPYHNFGALPTSRSYATTSDLPEQEYSWPGATSFTPYEVLNLPRTAPYSKNRYYDLVKVYHPDRPCNEHRLCRDLSAEVRLRRYHIVVEAHEILSDPDKRAAYDQFGAGWKHGPKRYNTVAEASEEWGAYGPTIYANATWEDWERWNNRHEKQQNVVDPRTFKQLLVLLLLFGGAVQASWITKLQTGYEEKLREASQDSMRFLSGRRQHTVDQMPSNDARVQSFLVRRDPTGAGLKEEEQPVYRRELHPRGREHGADAAETHHDGENPAESVQPKSVQNQDAA